MITIRKFYDRFVDSSYGAYKDVDGVEYSKPIKEVEKRVRKKSSEEYNELLKSGMFFEFYPTLSGEWEKDKKEFRKLLKKLNRENITKMDVSWVEEDLTKEQFISHNDD